jgi:hypothetical protein
MDSNRFAEAEEIVDVVSSLQKYEVTFVVRNSLTKRIDHKWTATWWARDFGNAEEQAVAQLISNRDEDSVIERIELW